MSASQPKRASASARLMYRSGLVPRRMALFGLVGGPLVCASGIAVMFGAFDAGSAPQGIATIPEIIWEAFLGIYLTFWGFKRSSVVFDESRDSGLDPGLAVAGS
jgi:peptidoglycan/LPS O-acetylase OafA/YrhL